MYSYIPIIKKRQSWGHLLFIMQIPLLLRWRLYTETAPRFWILNLYYHRKKKSSDLKELTHWGQVTHMCISNMSSIGSDNGLSPGRRQTITCIWLNAAILSTRPEEHISVNFHSKFRSFHSRKFTWRCVKSVVSSVTHFTAHYFHPMLFTGTQKYTIRGARPTNEIWIKFQIR